MILIIVTVAFGLAAAVTGWCFAMAQMHGKFADHHHRMVKILETGETPTYQQMFESVVRLRTEAGAAPWKK